MKNDETDNEANAEYLAPLATRSKRRKKWPTDIVREREEKEEHRRWQEQLLAKEAAKRKRLEAWYRYLERVEANWDNQASELRSGRYFPMQENGRNFKILMALLPLPVADMLKQRMLPPSTIWGCAGKPPIRGPFTCRGGQQVIIDGMTLGGPKKPRRLPGFAGIVPFARFKPASWEFLSSLRGPSVPELRAVNWLLACPEKRAHGAETVVIPFHRVSTDATEATARARKDAPDALHFFASGQGPGVSSFVELLAAATIARFMGYKVDFELRGEPDRFLRTGNYPGLEALKGAGIKVRAHKPLVDDPFDEMQKRLIEKNEITGERLRVRLQQYVRLMCLNEVAPELIVEGIKLRGLLETLAVGSGLDWITVEEAIELRIDRHFLALCRNHNAWRRNSGQGGSWLVSAGFRRRMGLPTLLRPVLPAGFEEAAMTVIKLRYPSAEFEETPIFIEPSGIDPHIGTENVKKLLGSSHEQLVAVDHTMIHWGSVLDLDTMLRQRGSALRTVFCSSYVTPWVTPAVLRSVKTICKQANARLAEIARLENL
jgi:hypothetical protein